MLRANVLEAKFGMWMSGRIRNRALLTTNFRRAPCWARLHPIHWSRARTIPAAAAHPSKATPSVSTVATYQRDSPTKPRKPRSWGGAMSVRHAGRSAGRTSRTSRAVAH